MATSIVNNRIIKKVGVLGYSTLLKKYKSVLLSLSTTLLKESETLLYFFKTELDGLEFLTGCDCWRSFLYSFNRYYMSATC